MKLIKVIKRRVIYSIVSLFLLIFFLPQMGHGSEMIEFGPEETELTGSIKYTVIGKYRFNFDQFRGEISFNRQTELVESVYLEIDAETIGSSCNWCDNIVRSKRLLHTGKYPKILFQGYQIVKEENGYSVKGILEMHGVKKDVAFPFTAEITLDENTQQNWLTIGGTWLIQRKDFDIVWNKILDQGGIMVGNYITVDWGIKSQI